MNKKDINDTIKCRKNIVAYIDYLDKGNETASEEFIVYVMEKIFTDRSLDEFQRKSATISIALNDKLAFCEVNEEDVTKIIEKQKVIFSRFRMLCMKECIISEIEKNYTRIDAIIKNPHFGKALLEGKIKFTIT